MDEIKQLLTQYQEMITGSDYSAHDITHTGTRSNAGFESCFKVYGCRILPPLMTQQKRKEMADIKKLVIQKENEIEHRRRQLLIDKVQSIVDTVEEQRTSRLQHEIVDPVRTHQKEMTSNLNIARKSLSESSSHKPQESLSQVSAYKPQESLSQISAYKPQESLSRVSSYKPRQPQLEALKKPQESDCYDSIQPVKAQLSDNSIVTISSHGSIQEPRACEDQVEIYKILNQLAQPIPLESSTSISKVIVTSSSSSSSYNSALNQTIIPADREYQNTDSIAVLQNGLKPFDCKWNDVPGSQGSLDVVNLRESVSDSEVITNFVGEYSRLPTPGPASTPDLSFISVENGCRTVSCISVDAGDYSLSGKLVSEPEDIDSPGQRQKDPTNTTIMHMTMSVDTLGQSCTLPISLVTESTCSTLNEVDEPWNTESVVVGNKSELEQLVSPGYDDATPQSLKVRRNSYTLEHPSPALLEAQAQNRAPQAQGMSLVKPIRRALDMSDDSFHSSKKYDIGVNKVLLTDVLTSDVSTEKTTRYNRGKKDEPTLSKTESEKDQSYMEAVEDASVTNAIYLQQQMDILESMQKGMMEEQRKQLHALMEQQQVQQRRLQDEMHELERHIRDKKSLKLTQRQIDVIEFEQGSAKDSEQSQGMEGTPPGSSTGSSPSIINHHSVISRIPGVNDFVPHQPLLNGSRGGNYLPLLTSSSPKCVPKDINYVLVSAVAKGYLTRRLMETQKVQAIVRTVKDTWQFIWQFQQETPVKKGVLSHSDTHLADRVIAQLRAAQFELHDIFCSLSASDRMSIIAHQRQTEQERMETKTDNPSHPLSAATRKAIQRRQLIIKSAERPQTAPPPMKQAPPKKQALNISKPNKICVKSDSEERLMKSMVSQCSRQPSESAYRPSKYSNQRTNINHSGISKTGSLSRNARSAHPFARPLSAASIRSHSSKT